MALVDGGQCYFYWSDWEYSLCEFSVFTLKIRQKLVNWCTGAKFAPNMVHYVANMCVFFRNYWRIIAACGSVIVEAPFLPRI